MPSHRRPIVSEVNIDPNFMRWMKGLDVQRSTAELLRREPENMRKPPPTQATRDDKEGSAEDQQSDQQQLQQQQQQQLAPTRTPRPTVSSAPAGVVTKSPVRAPLSPEQLQARRERDERHHKVAEALGRLQKALASPPRLVEERGGGSSRRQRSANSRFATKGGEEAGGNNNNNNNKRLRSRSPGQRRKPDNQLPPPDKKLPGAFIPRTSAAMRTFARGFQQVVTAPMAKGM